MTASKPKAVVLSVPTSEFRSLPVPFDGSGRKAKLSTCFVRAEDLPEILEEWMEVNPRIPKRNKSEALTGRVVKAIVQTLEESPDLFAFKNQGVWLLADTVSFEKAEGGKGIVSVKLSNPDLHGLVNGGHTYLAIRQVAANRILNEVPEPWGAYVRVHIIEGVEQGLVTELAEGLNRSMAVDNPSLENLRGTFDEIKATLQGTKGDDKVAYFQGAPGEMEISELLAYLSIFNMDRYPDRKTHPNRLFGQPKHVLDYFVEDCGKKSPAYKKVLPLLHQILVLSEEIEKQAAKPAARMKINESKKQNRVASPKHKGRTALFTTGTIDGKIPQGWLMPMLAGFRANVNMRAWKEDGKFEWLAPISEVLPAVIEEMVQVTYQTNKDQNFKPAEVGKKESAYRLCYGIVQMELAGRGLLTSS